MGAVRDPVAVLLETLHFGSEPDPVALRSAWRGLRTAGLASVVRQEGCGLWLYRRLKGAGAEDAPDPVFAAWLSQLARDHVARNLLVDAQVARLSDWLTSNRYPHVWLKGVARRVGAARYPYADARATGDVDLIVPHDRATEVWNHMQRAGYQPAGAEDRTPLNHFHLTPLWGTDRVAVELHLSTSKHESPEEAWRRATSAAVSVARNGLEFPIPCATELLWHSITHGLIQGSAAFRLRYFLDASVILASAEPIAWDVIEGRLDSSEVPSRDLALTWLGAAEWLAGRQRVLDMPRTPFDLGRTLRWRLAVHRHGVGYPRVVDKLIEEGTRAEVGWPIVPGVRGTSPVVRLRRRLAALAARGAYRAWRTI